MTGTLRNGIKCIALSISLFTFLFFGLATAQTSVPSIPLLVSPGNGLTTSATVLRWQKSTGTSNYIVQVASDISFNNIICNDSTWGEFDTTKAVWNNINNNSTYYWRVKAKNSIGYSDWSELWNFTVNATKPGIPTLLSPTNDATNINASPTMFSFGEVSDATTYDVQVSTDPSFTNPEINNTKMAMTSFGFDLQHSKTYYWRVRGENVFSKGNWSVSWSFSTSVYTRIKFKYVYQPSGSTNVQGVTIDSVIMDNNRQTSGIKFDTKQIVSPWQAANLYFVTDPTQLNQLRADGANGLYDYGSIDFDGLVDITPGSFTNIISAVVGNTYGAKTIDNKYAKIKLISIETGTNFAPFAPSLSSPINNDMNVYPNTRFWWNSSSEATTYNLQISTDIGFGSLILNQSGITNTYYDVQGLPSKTLLYWRVNASNSFGTSDWSGLWSFQTRMGSPTLVLPVSGDQDVVFSPTLAWKGSIGATYRLQVTTDPGWNSFIIDQSGITDTFKVVNGLTPMTWYYWRINMSKEGETSEWSGIWNFRTKLSTPSIPKLVSPGNNSNTSGTVIKWNKSVGTDNYIFQVATDDLFNSRIYFDSTRGGEFDTTISVTNGITNGDTYYWKVRAKNNIGYSDWSEVWSFTINATTPGIPTLSTPLNNAQNFYGNLYWNEAVGATTYSVQVSTDQTFTNVDFNWAGHPNLNIGTDWKHSKTYYWRVRGENLSGYGPWSEVRSFSTGIYTRVKFKFVYQPSGTNDFTGLSVDSIYLNNNSNTSGFQFSTKTILYSWMSDLYFKNEVDDVNKFYSNNGSGGVHDYGAIDFNTKTSIDPTSSGVGPNQFYNSNGVSVIVDHVYGIVTKDGSHYAKLQVTSIESGANFLPPEKPVLVSPINSATDVSSNATFTWNGLSGSTYRLQVSSDPNFNNNIFDQSGISNTSQVVNNLSPTSWYYWRVNATLNQQTSDWSDYRNFLTGLFPPMTPQLASPANNSSISGTVLKWHKSIGAEKYLLQVSRNNAFTDLIYNDSTWGEQDTTKTIVNQITNNSIYYWRVKANNSIGYSDWSTYWSFTVNATLPPGITTLVSPANNVQNYSGGITYNESFGATTYNVQVSTDQTFTKVDYNWPQMTLLSFSSDWNHSKTYYWRVRGENLAGSGAWSEVRNFSTGIYTRIKFKFVYQPDGSTGLSGLSVDSIFLNNNRITSGIQFATKSIWAGWNGDIEFKNEITDVNKFYSNNDSGGVHDYEMVDFDSKTSIDPSTAGVGYNQFYNSGGVSAVVGHVYGVVTRDGSHYAKFQVVSIDSGANLLPPDKPVLLSPITNVLDVSTNPTFSWNGNIGATYRLQVSTNPSFNQNVYDQSGIINTSQIVNNLSSMTWYYWRVNAIMNGQTSEWTDFRSFRTNLTVPTIPTLVSPANGLSTSSTLLKWNKSVGTERYYLQVSTNNSFNSFIYNDSTCCWEGDTSRAITNGIINGSTYYWRVKAKNSIGYSDWSSIRNFTVNAIIPEVPILLSPANNIKNFYGALIWSEVTNATNYNVQISIDPTFTNVDYNQGGLIYNIIYPKCLHSKTYYWRVQGCNVAGNSNWSEIRSFTTSVVTRLKFRYAYQPDGSSKMSGLPIDSAVIDNNPLSTFQFIQNLSYGPDIRFINDSGQVNQMWGQFGLIDYGVIDFNTLSSVDLQSSGLYYNPRLAIKDHVYGIITYGGNYAKIQVLSIDTGTSYIPLPPILVSPLNNSLDQTINTPLSWSTPSGASTYWVQVSTDSSFINKICNDSLVKSNGYNILNLQTSTKYYWRVSSWNQYQRSSWSAVWNFTTEPNQNLPVISNIGITPQSSGTTNNLFSVKAVDENIAWACGASGTILRTVNGGLSWEVKTAPDVAYRNNSIDATDSSNAWVIATASNDMKIFKTSDGGKTWILQYSNTNSFADAIRFFDSQNGVALGDPAPGYVVLTTSNGGNNWTQIDVSKIPSPTNSETGYINGMCVNGNNAWFVNYGSSIIPKVYRSTDRGQNWSVSNAFSGSTVTSLLSINFKDALNGIGVSNNGKKALTSDGGINWQSSTIVSTSLLRGVSYLPGTSNVIAVGNTSGTTNGLAYFSLDNGSNWNIINLPSGTLWLRAVSFNSNKIGWIVGTGGTVIKVTYPYTPAPIAPTLLSPVDKSPNESINSFLVWNKSTNAATYLLQISKDSSFSILAKQDSALVDTTKTLSGLSEGKYYWRVKARNNNGVSGWSLIRNFSVIKISNNWSFARKFADVFRAHGVIVTSDSNIWTASYSGWDNVHVPGQSLKSIMIFRPDGTPFDTIWQLTINGVQENLTSSGRGFSLDVDGNVLYSSGDILYKINYKTRQGMNKIIPLTYASTNGGLTKPATDAQGNCFISFTWPNGGLGIPYYSNNFNLLGYVSPSGQVVNTISRVVEVTPDGKDLYLGCTEGISAANYHSNNGIAGPYSFNKYIGNYPLSEALGWDRQGRLWIGSRTHNRYDAWDLSTMQVVDNINSSNSSSAALGFIGFPRGISFSTDGKYCYTADYNAGCIQLWMNNSILSTPTLATPLNLSNGISSNPTLTWNTSDGADSYRLEVSKDSSFNNIVFSLSGIIGTSKTITGLLENSLYYWRVNALNSYGISQWSDIWKFTTMINSHKILVQGGWNMISSYISPKNSLLDSILINSKSKIIIMKTGDGRIYYPQYSIDQIVNWDYKHGYQVYMSSGDSINLSGSILNPTSSPIPLIQGWNLAAYLRSNALLVDSAVISIFSNIVIIKDGLGKIYYPSLSINQIGNLLPGQGYQIYLSLAATLTYPENKVLNLMLSKKVDENDKSNISQTQHYKLISCNTGSNATIVIVGDDLKDNDEIGVWSNGKLLVGSGLVENGKCVITIWGDNIYTENSIEGALNDETLSLSYWSASEQKEKLINIKSLTDGLSNKQLAKIIKYNADAFWIASIEKQEEKIPNEFGLSQNYPNPFNPSTLIKYSIPIDCHVKLEVYNSIGQKVATLIDEQKSAGFYDLNFESSSLSSGIYFYRLQTGSFVNTKKMLIMK